MRKQKHPHHLDDRVNETVNTTICQQKKKLFDAYRNAIKAHSESLADLKKQMGTSSKAEYDAMYRRTEALSYEATKAKDALDKHVAVHAC
jgi:hypothetical protein